MPVVRNGHTMNHFQGKLFMFGGIHDITWELDDLHIYDLKVHLSLDRLTNGLPLSKILPGKLIGKLS